MRYNPSLDGLRGLSALAVVGFHARAPGFHGGFIGVDVFFVLSGYLITRVLGERPDLCSFYWRRFKRLVPPLALLLVAYLLVYPLLVPGHPHGIDALVTFLYLSDYGVAFWDTPNFLRHTWSLSVEEHFYLLWPLAFLAWRPGFRALLVVYILATAWRWYWPDWGEAYYRFDTHAAGLVLGCLVAGLKLRHRFPAWPGMVVLAVGCVTFRWNSTDVQQAGWVIVELAAAVAILGSPPKWLSAPPLVYLGKLSYGLYLWHYPIARIFRDSDFPWPVILAVSLAGGLAMAAISYHTIEAAFRRTSTGQRSVPA